MFFTEKNRKKNLIIFLLALPLFCGAVFLLQAHSVDAQGYVGMPTATAQKASADAANQAAGGGGNWISNAFDLVFKGILLGIFTMIGWMASVAITLFEWVIKPENVSGTQGLLNQSVVYEMWKFIRDFFNLFFILVLLYVAFKIVFQIEHDFKKTLLSIVLAALFINFSYPVTRVLIDVTNVPMYFFANQMASTNGGGTSVFGQSLSASRIKGILIPGAENGGSVVLLDPKNTYGRFLIAIVFMFLFAVTLLVLAVMFVVRLVALVILVIFSPVGFAASIVPGLSSYSKMWWDNFWKYAFFGPAAMLMLLVSVRFFSALGDEKTGIFKGVVAAANSNVSSDPTFFASMALFSVPIIMLWMAMGLAQEFSIKGAGSVVGMGQKFSTWAGKAPFRAGWAGAKWAGGKAESKLAKGKFTKYLSPTVIKEAWKARSEEQHHEDKLPIEMARGQMHDDFNKGLNYIRSKNKLIKNLTHEGSVDNEFAAENKQKAHYEAEIKEEGGGEVTENAARRALKEGLHEHNRVKVLAASTLLSRINGLDNVVGDFHSNPNYATLLSRNAAGMIDNQKSFDAVMTKMLKDLGISDESIMKHIANFGENAKSKGDASFSNLYEPNIDTGEWQRTGATDPSVIAATAVSPAARAAALADMHSTSVSTDLMKMKAQTRHDVMHARTMFTLQVDPATGKSEYADMNEIGEKVALRYTTDDVSSANRENNVLTDSQVNAYTTAKSSPANKLLYPRFVNAYNTNSNFREIIAQKIHGKNGKVASTGAVPGPNEVPFSI